MIRAHEKLIAWRAGIFSVLVHGVLLAILLISVNWKAEQPRSIAQVELWDSLPTDTPVVQPPVVKPIPPEPEPKPPEPKPLPKPPEPDPLPPEPKADIQIEKKPDPAIKAREEELKRKQEQKRKDEEKLKVEQKRIADEKRKAEEKRQLQELQKMIAEENKEAQQERQQTAQSAAAAAAASAANATEMEKYMGLISNKIRGYVNPQLCGTNKVDLKFHLALLPTGELAGNPRLLKSSGIAVCDQAVERAIRQAQPLPLPTDPDLRARFRDIAITFFPN